MDRAILELRWLLQNITESPHSGSFATFFVEALPVRVVRRPLGPLQHCSRNSPHDEFQDLSRGSPAPESIDTTSIIPSLEPSSDIAVPPPADRLTASIAQPTGTLTFTDIPSPF